MAPANGDKNPILFNLRGPRVRNVVVREVRDRDGRRLGRVMQKNDGTEDGVIAAAQTATERMNAEFSTASISKAESAPRTASEIPSGSQEPPCEVGLGRARLQSCR